MATDVTHATAADLAAAIAAGETTSVAVTAAHLDRIAAVAVTDVPVAVEIDGYDEPAGKAWSVVVKGRAERIQQVQELTDTLDLPLFPWQAGRKGIFVRVVPSLVTGRRFPVADPEVWRTPLSGVRRSPDE